MNTDAALFSNPNRYGYGWVLRDDRGVLVAARSHSFLGLMAPDHAEAFAIKEAHSWLKTHHFSNVIIKSDAKLIVHAIIYNVSFLSDLKKLLSDITSLKSSIENISFRFVKRSANQVAHSIVRASNSMSDLTMWYAAANSVIDFLLCSDLA